MILLEKSSLDPEKSGEIPHMEVTTEPKILIQALHEGKKDPTRPFPEGIKLPFEGGQRFSSLIFAGNVWNDSRAFVTSSHLSQFQRAHPGWQLGVLGESLLRVDFELPTPRR